MIIGTTGNEFSTMVWHFLEEPLKDDDAYAKLLARRFPKPQPVLERYPASAYPSPLAAWTTLLNDRGFVCPTHQLMAAAKHPERLWRFVYQHTWDVGPLGKFGAGHGMDMRALFHNASPSLLQFTDREEELSAAMLRYWVRFAATGNPNGGGDVKWPAYSDGAQLLTLDTPIDVAHDDAHQCDFWNAKSAHVAAGP